MASDDDEVNPSIPSLLESRPGAQTELPNASLDVQHTCDGRIDRLVDVRDQFRIKRIVRQNSARPQHITMNQHGAIKRIVVVAERCAGQDLFVLNHPLIEIGFEQTLDHGRRWRRRRAARYSWRSLRGCPGKLTHRAAPKQPNENKPKSKLAAHLVIIKQPGSLAYPRTLLLWTKLGYPS